ncbi:LysR family transcriptional regulator [Actinacidiphila sp. bgisy160]|uniref:LysR family transcriptional regulator n=1 Tax=Actinacidiphila sp. bgisy160 TaxID=3413796 RepID=UPI003D712E39
MVVDPGQLRLLTLIERHGSLTAAAHALQLTPAAVTQQVAKAERDWQVPLVIRGPRGATLTAAGALLASHGHTVEEASDKAEAELAALLGHLSLRLRIGTFQAAALHLLPPALTTLRHRHPGADVSVVDVGSARGAAEISAGRLDVAIVASWGTPLAPPPHVRAHPLLLDPMVVVLPDDHPLATGQPADTELHLEQLRDESWVSILAGHAAREQFHDAAREAGFTPTVRFETESYDVAQALVGTGIAVALVSRLALTHAPGTTHRELAHPRPHRQLYAVTKADASLTPLADMLIDLLRDVARDITATWEAPPQEGQRSSNAPHGARKSPGSASTSPGSE